MISLSLGKEHVFQIKVGHDLNYSVLAKWCDDAGSQYEHVRAKRRWMKNKAGLFSLNAT